MPEMTISAVLCRSVNLRYPSQVYMVVSFHLPVFRPYAVIQLFHHTDEGHIFMPEWRVVPLLLNQQRRNARLRCSGKRCRQSLRTSPELFVTSPAVAVTGYY